MNCVKYSHMHWITSNIRTAASLRSEFSKSKIQGNLLSIRGYLRLQLDQNKFIAIYIRAELLLLLWEFSTLNTKWVLNLIFWYSLFPIVYELWSHSEKWLLFISSDVIIDTPLGLRLRVDSILRVVTRVDTRIYTTY